MPRELDLSCVNPLSTIWGFLDILRRQTELNSTLGEPPEYDFDPLKADIEGVHYLIREQFKWFSRRLGQSNSAKGFPDGYWYMVTITQKDTESKDNILKLHAKTLEFFKEKGIVPYMAALEHSNIWHVHYCCKFRDYKKNEQRDLTKLLKRRVQIEKRVNTLKQWNGLNKYIMKRDHAKADTSETLLIDLIGYEEGKGYFIKE